MEDEEDLAVSLKYNLEKEGGYTVVTARTGEEGLATAHRTRFDLVILDLMLPEMDGLDVCRSLRAIPEYAPVPIFFLTARVEESDKLIGLEMGADDYLTKPFSMKELLARVKAHLRRSDRTAAPGQGVYRGGGIEMDYEGHILRSGDREIPLTRLEFALLAALIRGRGRVLSRDHLLEKVWGYDYPGDTRTVDVHVRRLRSKLGRPGERIETVIGVGYRFRDSGAPSGGD